MTQAIYVMDDESIDYVAPGPVAAGDVVVLADLIGVAKRPLATGELGTLDVEGVYDFTKVAGGGTAIPLGTKVYWDPAAKHVTITSTGMAYLGKIAKAAADGDTTARVRLCP